MSAAVGHPAFARLWAWSQARLQPAEIVEHRRRTLAGLRGSVLELGAGSGTNLPHYPATVDRVLAVEPEPYLRARALEAARDANVRPQVEVSGGDAGALPAADGSFDAAVACLVLCSVPDPAAALAELRRVLRPGGELRVYEHVAAPAGRRGQDRLQRLADATLWPRAFGGCHTHRDTGAALAAAGLRIVRREALDVGGRIGRLTPVGHHLLAVAVRD